MKKLQSCRKPMLDIGSASATDIIMNLFLFYFIVFSVLANFEDPQPATGVEVDLPTADADVIAPEGDDLVVSIACARRIAEGACADGAYFLGDLPVDLDRLERSFRAAAERDDQTLVILRADVGVRHGLVIAVMDLARREGLSRIAIATEPYAQPAP